MSGETRRVLRVLVDEGVRQALRDTGRNPLIEEDLEGHSFSQVPVQKPSRHGVFVAYFEYEGNLGD